MSIELTHYELLGVATDAQKDDIRAAYQDKLADVRAEFLVALLDRGQQNDWFSSTESWKRWSTNSRSRTTGCGF